MTGIYGKLPSHGDFVRRDLPQAFVVPWDEWLQAGLRWVEQGHERPLAQRWAAAPAWRFHLPPGCCGDTAVVGVMLPSQDSVGRPFPLTLAALVPEGGQLPNAAWYAAVEQAGLGARDRGDPVDALLAALPAPEVGRSFAPNDEVPVAGWWTREGRRLRCAGLPGIAQFRLLLDPGAAEAADGAPGGARRPTGHGISHRGTVRSRNEDSFVDRGDIGLWAVADGAGGHGDGNLASGAVAEALAAMPAGLSAGELLGQVRQRLATVHAELQRRAEESATGELTVTTVVVLMAAGDHFACLWAGDSRAYLWRDGVLCQMTHDHSLVQELVAAGTLAPEDAESHPQANVITRAVGSQEELQLDKVAGRLQAGDVILLCSDGLFKALPESQIASLLASGGGPEQLLDQALKAGARDNVTAVIIEV